jgi:hypothetical protein
MGVVVQFPSPAKWEPWVDEATCARHFSVSARTLRRYRRLGCPSRKLAGHRRYRLSEVEAWLIAHGEARAS